ncbi:murein biosynthesis integral membrane protein MurJ [Arenibacter aquaticus]|uniref:murein biosynthesis integral membrane protein MurJ n=1 Tax=Arenibacter aquaticus TaxID=2489054 RepID=UPI001EE3E38F|nr:lipid II flippase MurJ [Arenibacter aquaticus]
MKISKLNLEGSFQFLKKNLNQQFIKNVITVGFVSLLIKALGFYKELVIAQEFGLSELLDTFLIAILIPGFISTVFLSSYKNVFIPNYISELKQKGDISSFQTTSFLVTLSIGLFFILITYLFSDVYLETFFAGHTNSYYDLIKLQLHYILPCLIFWAVSSLLTGLLNIDNEYFFASFGSLFMTISIIVCLLFFKEALKEKVLAVGMLIGSFLDFLFLLGISIKRKIIHIGTPDFKSKNIRILIKQVPAKISSSLINGLNPIVDQYFSAQLVVGSIAALSYGLKIPAFIIGLIGIALGNVLLPYFSSQAVENYQKTYKLLQKMLLYNFIGCTLLALGLILFSEPIVSLVYERNAFKPDDTQIVYRVQQMYLLQIPFYVMGMIMNRYLTAINKNNFLVVTSTISLLLNIILNYILIRAMGLYGLALGTSIVSLTNTVVIYFYINRINKLQHV